MALRLIRRFFRDPLEEALDWIETHAMPPIKVDWLSLRRDAQLIAGQPQTGTARGRAIRMVLSRIGDRHGQLISTEDLAKFRAFAATAKTSGLGLLAVYPERVIVQVFPGGPAARAYVHLGDVVTEVNSQPPKQLRHEALLDLCQHASTSLSLYRPGRSEILTVRLEPELYVAAYPPSGRKVGVNISYIALPSTANDGVRQYLLKGQHLIRELDGGQKQGWILDLRHNLGGDLYAMLGAIEPILGEGDVGGLVDAKGYLKSWSCSNGDIFLGKKRQLRGIAGNRSLDPPPPIAVLTSRLTASAGEAVVVALRGRPCSRSFGESTSGVPTGLEEKKLSDGTLLRCSTTAYVDRRGRQYHGPIAPDQVVKPDWSFFGTDRDPVVSAAVDWLRRQGS